MKKRASGILLPMFSLPSNYGIGTMGKAAYDFIDFLKASKQKFWQMLPIGPISYGDSPYQSFSSFAGNPYFIDLDLLIKDNLLSKSNLIDASWGENPSYINYEMIYNNRFTVLEQAYANGFSRDITQITEFRQKNNSWIEDYALFMALKNHFNQKSWRFWDKDIRSRTTDAMNHYRELLEDKINFWVYLQFLFYKQWAELKFYANENSIKIIGDIPIYVAEDSADAWANTDILQFDEDLNPIKVSGCPPDDFTADGQLWGNPLYNWDVLKERNFEWWLDRIEATTKLFDVIRIDHFRGLDAYYSIPFGNKNAKIGEWVNAPGVAFVKSVKKRFKNIDIIAEDLGFLTKSVKQLQKNSGYPGMKVLEFAFAPNEDSDYLPHNYEKNCVVYTGTHDNKTIMGWLGNCPRKTLSFIKTYCKLSKSEGYNWGLIRSAWSSTANLAVAQMQDFLGLDNLARMNTPSTLGGNWEWRVTKEQMSPELASKIAELTTLYRR